MGWNFEYNHYRYIVNRRYGYQFYFTVARVLAERDVNAYSHPRYLIKEHSQYAVSNYGTSYQYHAIYETNALNCSRALEANNIPLFY